MWDGGVNVGFEAVLQRQHRVPESGWPVVDHLDFHDRLDAFESVFPGNDQPDRRPVLLG